MARRDYLSTDERIRFDAPPQLSSIQRLIFADLPLWADQFLTAIHTPTNKVGFVLQLGYFRVVTAQAALPILYPGPVFSFRCGLGMSTITAPGRSDSTR